MRPQTNVRVMEGLCKTWWIYSFLCRSSCQSVFILTLHNVVLRTKYAKYFSFFFKSLIYAFIFGCYLLINWWKKAKTIYLSIFLCIQCFTMYTVHCTDCTESATACIVSPTCELNSQIPWFQQTWKSYKNWGSLSLYILAHFGGY